jgi:hypothetical protein
MNRSNAKPGYGIMKKCVMAYLKWNKQWFMNWRFQVYVILFHLKKIGGSSLLSIEKSGGWLGAQPPANWGWVYYGVIP